MSVQLHQSPHIDTNVTDRTKRVKDAKSEAQKEIEEYRKKKEGEYKKFESEVSPTCWVLSRLLIRP